MSQKWPSPSLFAPEYGELCLSVQSKPTFLPPSSRACRKSSLPLQKANQALLFFFPPAPFPSKRSLPSMFVSRFDIERSPSRKKPMLFSSFNVNFFSYPPPWASWGETCSLSTPVVSGFPIKKPSLLETGNLPRWTSFHDSPLDLGVMAFSNYAIFWPL